MAKIIKIELTMHEAFLVKGAMAILGSLAIMAQLKKDAHAATSVINKIDKQL